MSWIWSSALAIWYFWESFSIQWAYNLCHINFLNFSCFVQVWFTRAQEKRNLILTIKILYSNFLTSCRMNYYPSTRNRFLTPAVKYQVFGLIQFCLTSLHFTKYFVRDYKLPKTLQIKSMGHTTLLSSLLLFCLA